MPLFSQPQRLLLAFGASLLLHALVLTDGDIRRVVFQPPARPASVSLRARLQAPDPGTLLKNTLDEERLSADHPPDRPAPGAGARSGQQALQRKLAQHLFYPPDAVARGLEGEVRLLLILDAQGRVLEARVASSSGHPMLDQAAADAAHALRCIPAAGSGELILPVVFKLQ